ncbi:hypothetical protein B0H13DRAFT_1517062, partial [Mycena leptocephala]
PVLELPNEIISEIFIHFLPIYPACPPLTGRLSPTTLTHICRKWREIALTTPLLWRAIGLSDERHNDICNTWLTRSRCCPLSIHVNEHFDWESMPQILSALISHRSRWEDLKVHFVGRDRPRIEGSMPLRLLRHLDLEFPSHAIQAATFSEAPLLRAVRLTGTLSVTLPWLQLTSITLCEVDPRQCEPILKQTSNIVHCELHFWISHPLADQPLSNIALPCLESLVLNRYSEPVTGYLAFISVPSLRSLRTPERFLGSDPIGLLASFISNSGCSLQEV